jgi:hypothetical protein
VISLEGRRILSPSSFETFAVRSSIMLLEKNLALASVYIHLVNCNSNNLGRSGTDLDGLVN